MDCSRVDNLKSKYGVAIIETKEISRSVSNMIRYNGRKILIQLEPRIGNIQVLQIYANNSRITHRFISDQMSQVTSQCDFDFINTIDFFDELFQNNIMKITESSLQRMLC